MDEMRRVVLAELQEIQTRLLQCYELTEELRHEPGLSPAVHDRLAGLHYSVAKASQDAAKLVADSSVWESE